MSRSAARRRPAVENLEPLLAGARALAGTGPEWVDLLRQSGAEHFDALGLPTTRVEDWKYTSVAALARVPFAPLGEESHSADVAGLLPAAGVGGGRPLRLVFADGRFAPELSARGGLPPGVKLSSLAARLRDDGEPLRANLGLVADASSDGFRALNVAHLGDGAVVEIADGTTVEVPIEIAFLNESASPILTNPRTLVVAGANSKATVVETHIGRGPVPYAANAVTEIVLGDGAELHHIRLQREGEQAFHVGAVAVRQGRASRYVSTAIALGAALSRVAIDVRLDATEASCTLDGLYLARGEQHVDHHTTIDHATNGTTSRQLYKGVLADRATGVFNGKVVVRADAQQTDAGQVNRNLLLSADATIYTKPELQILADDVKCAHGATIGRLDEEAIFYLRARGIGEEEARRLLLYAFASEIVDRVAVEALRGRLGDEVWGRFGDPRDGESPR